MSPKPISHLSPLRLKKITNLFNGYLDRNELPHAAVLIGIANEILYKEKFGWQDIENNLPIQFDSIYRIMSMTKPVTAVAAMLLYEEGVFDLNTPIHRFLSIFKEMKVLKKGSVIGAHDFEKIQSPITFRHLFTHTSGLSYGGPTGELIDDLYNPVIEPLHAGKRKASIQESIEILAGLPLAFQPGTSWRYGLNLDVLGALVEVISGMPLGDFLQQRIFTPLGMVDTAFDIPEENSSRLAVLYQRGEKPGELTRQDLPLPLPAFMWGGGGLLSTLEDYAHFAAMLANGGRSGEKQFLSPTTVCMFSQNWAPPETITVFQAISQEINGGYGYSLGTAVLMDPSPTGKFGHVGEFYWGGAFGTYFFVDPVESLYAVFMTQLNPNWAYPIPWQLKQLIYQAFV